MGLSRHPRGRRGLQAMLTLLLGGVLPVAAADAAVVKVRPLPNAIAQSANALQRAVWACEAGGQAGSATHARFFLGAVDHGAGLGDRPPLVLTARTLSGLGQISNDQGWFNIRFACGLAAAGDQARSFAMTVLSPMKANEATPGPAIPTATGDSWYVIQAGGLTLAHGAEQTDDRDFLARCMAKSGIIEVRLTHTASWLSAGRYATIAITSGGRSLVYVARGVQDENLGAVIPVVALAPDDPLFAAMATASDLSINIGADTLYTVLLNGAGVAVRSFVAGCGRG